MAHSITSRFPNLVPALEDLMPVICTLLVGFVGVVYITIGTTHDKLPDVVFQPLLVFRPDINMDFKAKGFLLTTSGLSSVFLYFCVVAMILSRMAAREDGAPPSNFRFSCAMAALLLFHTGVLLLIFTGLSFATQFIFSLFSDFFSLFWIIYITRIFIVWRRGP
jgi:hypothetical protein